MNMDNLDQGTLDQNVPVFGQPKQRGWWSRNWLWFVPTLLLTLIIVCCGCFSGFFMLGVRVLRAEPYPTALKLVQEDPRVIERLGQPISDVSWVPIGELNVEGDKGQARLDFDVAGPKGRAHVHYQARQLAGKWGFSQLEVTFAPGDRISLRVDAGDEAPPFEGPKPDATKPEGNAPAPEINLLTPPDDAPGVK